MNNYATLLTDFRNLSKITADDYVLEKGYQCFRVSFKNKNITVTKKMNTITVNSDKYNLENKIVVDILNIFHNKYGMEITKYAEQPMEILNLPAMFIADFTNIKVIRTVITEATINNNNFQKYTDKFLTEYTLQEQYLFDSSGTGIEYTINETNEIISEGVLGGSLFSYYKADDIPLFIIPEYSLTNYNQLIKHDKDVFDGT